MAAAVAREPKKYPCGHCDCDPDGLAVDGGTWSIPDVIDKSPICLRRLITPRTYFLFDLYQHYQNGVLPVAGGLLDQPRVYLRAMTTLSYWMNKPL